jgi:hypothetical protein
MPIVPNNSILEHPGGNSSPLVEEKFYLITCPLNTQANFFCQCFMMTQKSSNVKWANTCNVQCGERFHFWPKSFSLVYPTPSPRKESNGVGWKFVSLGTCVLSRVTNKGTFSFIVLSCSTYKVSGKKTLAQELQYSCCYGAHIFLSTKKHLGTFKTCVFLVRLLHKSWKEVKIAHASTYDSRNYLVDELSGMSPQHCNLPIGEKLKGAMLASLVEEPETQTNEGERGTCINSLFTCFEGKLLERG